MKVKINKAFLIKNHFWILLGIYTPLVLVALAMLWTSVADAIEEKRNKIKKTKTDIEAIVRDTNIRNQLWLEGGNQKEKDLAAQKEKVWEQVWKGQASMVVWPKFLIEKFPELKNKDFGEPITDFPVRDNFINEPNEQGYQQMLADMILSVQPILSNDDVKDLRALKQEKAKTEARTEGKTEGVIQFKDGWAKVIRHVTKWVDPGLARSAPTSEEVWLALEDLWVQRELLQAIRDANDFVAIFKKTGDSPRPDVTKGEVDRQTFVTPRWKLELIMTRDKLLWQITNIGVRQQTLGHTFRIKLLPEGSKPLDLFVDGEPLMPYQSTPWATARVDNPSGPPKDFNPLGFKGIGGVEQVINWQTAPVKRIDKIALAYRSHRTTPFELKPPPAMVEEVKKEERKEGIGGGSADARFAGGAKQAEKDSTFDKNRYIDVTQQVRRMPLGVVVIVDQAHVQDVLTAIANSRLRVQITQTQMQRYRGSIKPVAEGSKPAGGKKPGIAGPATATTPQSDTPEDEAANLVELAVYGTASLYQKCPEKQAEGAAAAPAAGAAAPPPVIQPAKKK